MPDNNEPTNKAIKAHLLKMLQHAEFKASEKQKLFLRFVIDEALAGRSSQIKAYTIAVVVYGRPDTFDPQVDPIVRVEAGRLRRALAHYYLTAGKNDPIRITIPKGSYVPAFQAIRKPVDATPTVEPSIAVFPLTNLSGDVENEYFTDGLTEELTSELSRYQGLRVIASQSTMQFKGQQINIGNISKDLGVRFLLAGSVRRDSQKIKVTIHLLDTLTAEQAWSQDYKVSLKADDLIAIQEKIAFKAVGIIADQFGLIARRLSKESRKKVPVHLETYDAVLRFHHYETILTADVFEEALSSLEQAIRFDPDYGLAHAMLGHLHADNYALGFCKIEAPLEKALLYAQKGVALDPQNQFAHDALTLVHFHQGNKASFMQHVKKTIDLNPNSPYIVGVAGWHMMLFGEWEKGQALLEKGINMNPLYPTWFHLAIFMNFYRKGEYENALTEALKFNIPGLFWDPVLRAAALGQLGRQSEAGEAIQQLIALDKNFTVRGRSLIGSYVKVDELIDAVIEGLQKAGLSTIK